MALLKQVTVVADGTFYEVRPNGTDLPTGDYVMSVRPKEGAAAIARWAINDVIPAADEAVQPLLPEQMWPISVGAGQKLWVQAVGGPLIVNLSA